MLEGATGLLQFTIHTVHIIYIIKIYAAKNFMTIFALRQQVQCSSIFGYFTATCIISTISDLLIWKMAESEQRNKENCIVGPKETMVKQEKRENTLTNGGKGSGDDADSLEELPLDIGEHYLVRRSDNSWRKYIIRRL